MLEIISVQIFYSCRRRVLSYSRAYTHKHCTYACSSIFSLHVVLLVLWIYQEYINTQTFRRYAIFVEFTQTLSYLMSSILVYKTALYDTSRLLLLIFLLCISLSAYNYSSLYSHFILAIESIKLLYDLTN